MEQEIRVRKCGCCGKVFTAALPESSKQAGDWFDLDQRPPEPMRSEMYRQIFRCPECGFSFGPRDRSIPREFVGSEEYRSCEGNQLPVGIGADYYRFGMTVLREGDKATAFASFLRAAWAFDDKNDSANAKKCRLRCVRLAEEMPCESALDAVVRADIYRRAGCFSELPKELTEQRYPDELTRLVMQFEVKKAAEGDEKAYTLEQCFTELGIKR
ncbi:hypothetical protein SAMN02910447_00052 [Ruminococcus sp. YE71]|uniref:hypothetical protein n=1 Tax=unclassified Ruminococcus TaxID=2608920 RepID=UPI00088B91A6|nr:MULTISPECIES: hypothetical protein [unclassified Ruminococcus]SDA10263.1 hypothetical protein SAMN02910446_00297 [Ruminococcus sp. YE78]SFW10891.1 hypothetical protein SAMN02910447_00052 [Ruminococcus sp. YE71]